VSVPVQLFRLIVGEGETPCGDQVMECCPYTCSCFERVSAWNFWHGIAIAGALTAQLEDLMFGTSWIRRPA
jgi:hypothetical protein